MKPGALTGAKSDALDGLAGARRQGRHAGITSVCSAHPLVIRAALRNATRHASVALIEATCNQVNHLGGYTGMRPAEFAALVIRIAAEEGLARENLILGGDHLGPNPWRGDPAEAAMARAEAMVRDYVMAGFSKIHLDTSMGCAGEAAALDDAATAERAARLAAVAEAAAEAAGLPPPRYIIGTEVPPPGGADHALAAIEPTAPAAACTTIAVHRAAFARHGLDAAFARVIGLVVQPGVEFGNENVIPYDPVRARPLTRVLQDAPHFVFEAHSTDYQGQGALSRLVADGFAILKVGPELTFVLRETLYGLDLIASDLLAGYGARPLYQVMERLMLADPRHWQNHHAGPAAECRRQRHYSLSDRIRYYWPHPEAEAACARLFDALAGRRLPAPHLARHLPAFAALAERPCDPAGLVVAAVERRLDAYRHACTPPPSR